MDTKDQNNSRLPAVLFLFFIFFISLFAFLVVHVLVKKNIDMDETMATFLTLHYNDGIGSLMKLFTVLGSAVFLVIAYAVLFIFYAFYRKNLTLALRILATGVCGYILMTVLKLLFHRTRPLHPLIHALNTFSFPSGHTTTSIVFFGIVIYLLWKERMTFRSKAAWSTFLIILGLLVGLSRVYLREHFLTDVLAGICVAYFNLYVTLILFEKFQPIKKIQTKFAPQTINR